jgi:YfiR/HmsC-like
MKPLTPVKNPPAASTPMKRPVERRRFVLALSRILLVWLVMGALQAAPAQDSSIALERRVKAAFLYKFLGFITWPDGAFAKESDPLVIGILGAPDIADELTTTIVGRTVQGRPVLAKALKPGDPIDDVHLLFIDARQREQLEPLARSARDRGSLLVSESSDALDQGVVINFVTVDSRVRFEVSLIAAAETGITISSRLLSVAHRIVGTVN